MFQNTIHAPRHSRRAALLVALSGLYCIGLFGVAACGPDREQLAKDVHAKIRADLEQQIRAEVERRLKAELPRLEAKLRAQLAGQKVAPGDAPLKSEPSAPADEKGDPKAAMAADPAAPKDPSGKPEPAPKADDQGFGVARVGLAKKIVNRKPVDEATAFTLADQRVYCFVDAKNPKGPDRMISVVWYRNDREFHRVRLRVGQGPIWRTWAYLTLRPQLAGNWRCSVFNEQQQSFGQVEFTVSK